MVQSFTPNSGTPLRIVGGPSEAVPANGRRDVAFENHAASAMGHSYSYPANATGESADLHAVFAQHVANGIEGGRAAILRPQTRERLLTLATRVGIRPFDAHLLMALMQDRARRGEKNHAITSDSDPVFIRTVPTASPARAIGASLTLAFIAACGIMLALVWFITTAGA
jgi:hypothetical protein